MTALAVLLPFSVGFAVLDILGNGPLRAKLAVDDRANGGGMVLYNQAQRHFLCPYLLYAPFKSCLGSLTKKILVGWGGGEGGIIPDHHITWYC